LVNPHHYPSFKIKKGLIYMSNPVGNMVHTQYRTSGPMTC
jgi:hypothetical protein